MRLFFSLFSLNLRENKVILTAISERIDEVVEALRVVNQPYGKYWTTCCFSVLANSERIRALIAETIRVSENPVTIIRRIDSSEVLVTDKDIKTLIS